MQREECLAKGKRGAAGEGSRGRRTARYPRRVSYLLIPGEITRRETQNFELQFIRAGQGGGGEASVPFCRAPETMG